MHFERRQKKDRSHKRRPDVLALCHKGEKHQLHCHKGECRRKTGRKLRHLSQKGRDGSYRPIKERRFISNISAIVHRKYPVPTLQHRKGNNRFPRFSLGIKNGFAQKGDNHKHTQQCNKPERLLPVRHTLFVFYVFWAQNYKLF